jgi:hypothetical protein
MRDFLQKGLKSHFSNSLNSSQFLIFLPIWNRAACFGCRAQTKTVQRIPYTGLVLWGEIDPKDSPPETWADPERARTMTPGGI